MLHDILYFTLVAVIMLGIAIFMYFENIRK